MKLDNQIFIFYMMEIHKKHSKESFQINSLKIKYTKSFDYTKTNLSQNLLFKIGFCIYWKIKNICIDWFLYKNAGHFAFEKVIELKK